MFRPGKIRKKLFLIRFVYFLVSLLKRCNLFVTEFYKGRRLSQERKMEAALRNLINKLMKGNEIRFPGENTYKGSGLAQLRDEL